jgi:NitT/TauT family transport system permease protein
MAEAAAEAVKTRRRLVRSPKRWALGGNAIELLALVGGVALWELLGRLLGLPWLPSFSSVVSALVVFIRDQGILLDLRSSLQALGIGFGVSLVLGVGVGALMGRYRRLEQALDIYVYAFFVAPSMIFAPIFFAIFGLSDATRIAVIVMYSLFVIIINTTTAVRHVDPALVEMARSFGTNERQIMMQILLPASLPLIFAGIRLGMGRAVKGMINGEMFIALVGLGALAQKYGSQFAAPQAFAIVLLILVVALVANWVVGFVDNRLTRWSD